MHYFSDMCHTPFMAKTLDQQANEIRARIPVKKGLKPLATHSGLSTRWISYFRDGLVPNPGVRTLDALNDALKKEKL